MELTHRFTVPVPIDDAWAHFNDIASVAECFPGATVTSADSDTFAGSVKVKLGPIALVYNGSGTFTEKDQATHRMVVDAKGKDKRGNGTAGALVTMTMSDAGGSATDVEVLTDLAITGKPAQFGRGVMAEVGNKLLGKFADCLAGELSGGGAAAGAAPASPPEPASAPAAHADAAAAPGEQTAAAPASVAASTTGSGERQATPAATATPIRRAGSSGDSDAIDLLDTAGLPVLKRLAPALVGTLILLVLWRLMARRR